VAVAVAVAVDQEMKKLAAKTCIATR